MQKSNPQAEGRGAKYKVFDDYSTDYLLGVVIERMEKLQSGPDACGEYAEVLMKSRKAREWLSKKE